MDRFRRPAPLRAAFLAATLLLIACQGTPTSTTEEQTSGGTRRVSKNPSPKVTDVPTGVNGTTTPTTQPTATTGATASPTTQPTATTGATTAPTATPTGTATGTPTTQPTGTGTTTPTTQPTQGTTPFTPAATPALGSVQVGTFAGSGTAGFDAGTTPVAAEVAKFKNPQGLAVHPISGDVYVADTDNHAIRKISGGMVTTVIGDGTITTPNDPARLNKPLGIAVASNGTIYVADSVNNRIRKLTAGATELENVVGNGGAGFAEGAFDFAQVNTPAGLALSADEKFLWVVDAGNHCIRRIDLATSTISTLAGSKDDPNEVDGPGVQARFDNPLGCAAVGNDTLYVCDFGNGKLRKVVVTGNSVEVSTIGATTFNLFTPADVLATGTIPETNGSLLVADTGTRVISRLAGGAASPESYVTERERGFANGSATSDAKFEGFGDMVVLPNGNILVADPGNNRIRKLTP
jgi:sugar lactone lactonase YvrE